MKKHDIFDAIGEIDDDLILDAQPRKKLVKKNNYRWKLIGVICAVVAVVAVSSVLLLQRSKEAIENSPNTTTESVSTNEKITPESTTNAPDTSDIETSSIDTTNIENEPIGGTIVCPVHSMEYHGIPGALFDGTDFEKEANEWFREGDKVKIDYNSNECYWSDYNICTFIDKFGITDKAIKDYYYTVGYYYCDWPIDLMLAHDWEGVELYYKNILNDSDAEFIHRAKSTEDSVKWVDLSFLLKEGAKYENIEWYNKITLNGKKCGEWNFSIPEFVYKTGMPREEFEAIIAKRKAEYVIFDYDIDMIYNQREYLEEQIAKAEYPVMVDELIRK